MFASRRWDLGRCQQGSVRKTNCTRRFEQSLLHPGRSVLAKLVEGWREDRGGWVAAIRSCQPCYPASGLPVASAMYLSRTLCLANQGRPLHLHVCCHYRGLVGMVSVSTSSQIRVGILQHQAENNPGRTWERGQRSSPRAQNLFERTENGTWARRQPL